MAQGGLIASVPFKSALSPLIGGNPIVHTSFTAKDGSYYMINQTVRGHDFHAGSVVSKLYVANGQVMLRTFGFGYGSNRVTAITNWVVGKVLFGMWQYGVTGGAKIQSGQIDPRALK